MVAIDNERKACDAVARCLEGLHSVQRSNECSPEDDRAGPPVEYVFNLAGQTYALEHTLLEAFEGQIRTGVHFADFVAPIIAAHDHKLPSPGKYHLNFKIDPTDGMKPRAVAKAQAAIIEWVADTAGRLHRECPEQPEQDHSPHGHNASCRDVIEGVELQLHRQTGWWMPERGKGRLFVGRLAPENHEDLRDVRIGRAMDAKLPKLAAWKEDGARSVLVLENRDLFLSNHVVILESVEGALAGRADLPDEIWLVDTTIEAEWTIWCLIRDGVSFPDEDTALRYREFRPEELIEV